MTPPRADAVASLDVPTEPLALRARRHAWAAVIARLPSTPRTDSPLMLAWEAHRTAWDALPADVREWAIAAGERRDMRVILCGLDGEHEMPSTWRVVPWKARGGYGGQRKTGTNENASRERLWLSPHCLGSDAALPLFGGSL